MNDEDKGLEHTLAHIILSMRATDSEQFAKLCELLDVDPQGFGEFIADDAKSQDN